MAAMLRRTLHDAANLVWRSRAASGMRRTLRLLGQVGVEPATIADVGASDGRWSQLARAAFPAAELVLFEPHPAHAAGLERFKTKNPDARIVRSAVGGAEGESLFDARDAWGGVLQDERTSGSITVSVATLDAALVDAKPPFMVKLDTHGAEECHPRGRRADLGPKRRVDHRGL